jgi:hypothetical protein
MKEAKESNGPSDKLKSWMHRMTRKKRRAREVREAMEHGDDTNDDENDQPQYKSLNEVKIKSDVRKQERLQAEMKRAKSSPSIHDVDLQEERSCRRKPAQMQMMQSVIVFIGRRKCLVCCIRIQTKTKKGESESEEKRCQRLSQAR